MSINPAKLRTVVKIRGDIAHIKCTYRENNNSKFACVYKVMIWDDYLSIADMIREIFKEEISKLILR